jgi:uncharacterized protein YdeI (YjbR/CyaY-like superfamily)
MRKKHTSRMKRPRYRMPPHIQQALVEFELMDAYRSRPPYQQNDYIGWITRAKKDETREKRLKQMLDELRRGNVYMKMAYKPKRTAV